MIPAHPTSAQCPVCGAAAGTLCTGVGVGYGQSHAQRRAKAVAKQTHDVKVAQRTGVVLGRVVK